MVKPQKLSESVMASAHENSGFVPASAPGSRISPAESARYTADMLESLRKLALGQGQPVLAHLLELAQAEARMLVRAPADAPA